MTNLNTKVTTVYSSLSKAAKDLNITSQTLKRYINDKTPLSGIYVIRSK